ncbi:MAG: hypothetical protein A3E83_00820 [Gammaproteobacteria bacterium RIFCSPHIGHO2_12_FULL_41_20]|nr:MAG: hypothetical protein A3E83_00820 [Gammaproteobacteria bacterium RIFCSPHIGHO2_12_FULL_41_20]
MKQSQITSDTYIVEVSSLSHDGRGIAVIQGKTTFIQGALPGEKIRCKLISQHTRYNEAEILEVKELAIERVTPGCSHFGICGGCSLQHLSNAAQLKLKQDALIEQLQHFGNIKPQNLLPPLTMHPWGYRRKARLGVRYVIKKNKVLVGFREKRHHYLADIHSCPVLHENIGLHINELSNIIRSLDNYKDIPQIEVAVGENATALVFRHLQPLTAADQEKLIAFANKHQFHLYLHPNPPNVPHKLWPVEQPERLCYYLPNYHITMHFHPLDFTQINFEINNLMIQQAITLLDLRSEDEVLDLFCGIGNFTLPIARHAKRVTGIEGSERMVERAKENAVYNNIINADFYTTNLQLSTTEQQKPWLQKTYTKILLDPPRTGIKDLAPILPQLNAEKIVYISCNPATLARDAGALAKDYQLTHAGIMNMFPHTEHIETMAVFERN